MVRLRDSEPLYRPSKNNVSQSMGCMGCVCVLGVCDGNAVYGAYMVLVVSQLGHDI